MREGMEKDCMAGRRIRKEGMKQDCMAGRRIRKEGMKQDCMAGEGYRKEASFLAFYFNEKYLSFPYLLFKLPILFINLGIYILL